jgi:glycosyltransferase involved in cell wall biosynthesis
MKLAIIGTRGIPARYGGFETFAEEISTLLAQNGIEVFVQCEVNSHTGHTYKGVNLIYSTVTKTDNPLKYYYQGIKWAVRNSDIILAASTAGSFFYFLNIFKKTLIITNPDGLEHQRRKWSIPKRIYLKLSEFLAVVLSDYLVVDSESIKQYLIKTYRNSGKKIRVIEYGAWLNNNSDDSVLRRYGLNHHGYYLAVCRLEPENNIDMIIEAFQAAMTICPLIIVGNLTNNNYVKRLVAMYSSGKIRFADGIYNKEDLNTLRFSCKAYIHGHSVGGTNPSLLEAMANRNIILAHNNVFNREVTYDNQLYFSTSGECRKKINEIELMTQEEIERYKELSCSRITGKYNWDTILKKYLEFFREILS